MYICCMYYLDLRAVAWGVSLAVADVLQRVAGYLPAVFVCVCVTCVNVSSRRTSVWTSICYVIWACFCSSGSGHSPGHIPLTVPLDNLQFSLLFIRCRTFPAFHRQHPPICSMKRSTVNVYKIERGRSVRVRSAGYCQFSKNFPPRGSVGVRTPRRGSVRVSASFQIFALTAGECPRVWGNCPGNCPGKMSGEMSRGMSNAL